MSSHNNRLCRPMLGKGKKVPRYVNVAKMMREAAARKGKKVVGK